MKPFIASAFAVFFHIFGFAIGCGIWVVVGWCLGSAFSHAPVSGALCGLVIQLAGYIYVHDQMWEHLQQSQQKLLAVLDQAFA